MPKEERDLVTLLWERDDIVRKHHELRTGRRLDRPFTLEGQAAQEIEGLRDEVLRLRRM
jgi:hypothetical protein